MITTGTIRDSGGLNRTMPETPEILRILAVVAHPADAFDMIGGTLANHVAAGDQATLVIADSQDVLNNFRLADEIRAGTASASRDTLKAAADRHVSDMLDACGILGIADVRFLEYEGEWLCHSPALVAEIATLVQQVRPHILITHHPAEDAGASEHGACGRMATEALALAEGARANGLPSHHVGQAYFFCPPGTTNRLDAASADRFPAILIDVTAQIEKKVKAYAKLAAQYIDLHRAAKIMEACSCGSAAIHSRVAYAESFQALRPEVYERLPVSPHNLRLSEGSWEDGLRNLKLITPFIDGVQQP